MPVPPPSSRKVPEASSATGDRSSTVIGTPRVIGTPGASLGVLVLGLLLGLGPAARADSAAGGLALLVAGVLAAAAAFGALTLAELATARATRRMGLTTGPVVVSAWGPAVRDSQPPANWQQARRLGRLKPLVTFGAGVLLLLLAGAAAAVGWAPPAAALVGAALLVAALAVLDLLPGPGRSGGMLVFARTWRRTDRFAAEAAVARFGIRTGWTLMALGLVAVVAVGLVGLWISVVGWLTLLSSRLELARTSLHARTVGVPARAAMTPGAPVVNGWNTVEAVLAQVGPTPYQVLPMRRFDGSLQAVLPIELFAVPGDDRDLRRVQDLARPVVLLSPDEPVERLLGAANGLDVPIALVVEADGPHGESRVLGVIGPAELARTVGSSSTGATTVIDAEGPFREPQPGRSVWDR